MAGAAATEQLLLLLLGIMVHGSMSMVYTNNIMASDCYNNIMVVTIMCQQLCWWCRHCSVLCIPLAGQDIFTVNGRYNGSQLYTVSGWLDTIVTTVCDSFDHNKQDSCFNGLLVESPIYMANRPLLLWFQVTVCSPALGNKVKQAPT